MANTASVQNQSIGRRLGNWLGLLCDVGHRSAPVLKNLQKLAISSAAPPSRSSSNMILPQAMKGLGVLVRMFGKFYSGYTLSHPVQHGSKVCIHLNHYFAGPVHEVKSRRFSTNTEIHDS